MRPVGRRRTINKNLPARLYLKRGRYYYGRNQEFAGDNLADALRLWAEKEATLVGGRPSTFADLAGEYAKRVLPTKATRTREDNNSELAQLLKVFGSGPLAQIRPTHVAGYLERRNAKVRGNREIALLSAVWNWGRAQGMTDLPNPCRGVRRNREAGRTAYVSDEDLRAVYAVASEPLRDALDLYYLTGQRVSDVLAMRLTDVRDGFLWLRQKKTGKALRLTIAGDLKDVLERIKGRSFPEGAVVTLALVRDESGQPLTYSALVQRHRRACKRAEVRFQLRDLRAKAGTDLEDLAHAQKLLGHSSRAMTEHYIKPRAGETVSPLLRTKRIVADSSS